MASRFLAWGLLEQRNQLFFSEKTAASQEGFMSVPDFLYKKAFGRTWKNVPATSKILFSSLDDLKNQRILRFYIHARLAMSFWA